MTNTTPQPSNEQHSPEFSPSILHNNRGPLNPHNQTKLSALMPKGMELVLKDKRFLAVVCLFLPPLAVFLKTGISRKFGLSLLLFAFFIFPGKIFIILIELIPSYAGILYGFYVTFIESSLESSTNPSHV